MLGWTQSLRSTTLPVANFLAKNQDSQNCVSLPIKYKATAVVSLLAVFKIFCLKILTFSVEIAF